MWKLLIAAVVLLQLASSFSFHVQQSTTSTSSRILTKTGSSSESGQLRGSAARSAFATKLMRTTRLFGAKPCSSCHQDAAQGHPYTTTTKIYPLKVIIAGAPAAGKGTQCEVIKARYGLIHLSTGDILRAAVKAATPLGLQAKSFMDAGKLVPDALIIDVVCDRLRQDDCRQRGWLLDGFPRTQAQADSLHAAGMVPDCFVLLDVPEAVLVERVTGRRTDPVTGKIYHLRYNPPPSAEVAARVVQRSDDTEEKIKVRYQDFKSNIRAVQASYADRIVAVDGSAAQADVSCAVCASLDELVDTAAAATGKQ